MNWKQRFLKLHYEPEHEQFPACWCEPKVIVSNKDGQRMVDIQHNEQRVILVKFIEDLIFDTKIEVEMLEGVKRYNQAKEDGTLDKHFPKL